MTTTADWLHLKLGAPLADLSGDDATADRDAEDNAGEIVARQRARASQPMAVVFTGR